MNNMLIREAQILSTGAEIHKTNGIVAMYRRAQKDTYKGPEYEKIAIDMECLLEQHVGILRSRKLKKELRVCHT